MKKQILLILGLFHLSLPALANYEACKIDLAQKFKVSESESGPLCSLDPELIQTCMNEQSELLVTDNFQILSEICIEHLALSRSEKPSF